MKIGKMTTIRELAAIVVEKLKEKKVSATLAGGAVVSIYTNNKYQSRDLDFISPNDHETIAAAMRELGFNTSTKDFTHPATKLSIEFPTGPLAIGDDEPANAEGKIKVGKTTIQLLSPTQCVMDRLSWFYSTNDRQCLDQAVWVAQAQPIKLSKIESWSKRENSIEKYEIFLRRLQSARATES